MKVNHTITEGQVGEFAGPITIDMIKRYIAAMKSAAAAEDLEDPAVRDKIRDEFLTSSRNAIIEAIKSWTREALEESTSEYLHRTILARMKECSMGAVLAGEDPVELMEKALADLEKEASSSSSHAE
jgi:hypothetical protein